MSPAPAILQAAALRDLDGFVHGFETRGSDLRAALPAPLLRLQQVHGAEVHLIGAGTDPEPYTVEEIVGRPPGDALVSGQPGTALAVATADCLPVLIADPVRRAVGAAHAGWRGLALGVLPATLAALAREHGSRMEDCIVAIGPRVGASAYRVSDDVAVAFRAAGIDEGVFSDPVTRPHEEGTRTEWLCDLEAAARAQIVRCGVPSGNIEALDACTVSQPDRFHSWRRDGPSAGRMLSGIALR